MVKLVDHNNAKAFTGLGAYCLCSFVNFLLKFVNRYLTAYFIPIWCLFVDKLRSMVDLGKSDLLCIINSELQNIMFYGVANHKLIIVGPDASYTKPFKKRLCYYIAEPNHKCASRGQSNIKSIVIAHIFEYFLK